METYWGENIATPSGQFKSYYVVWKLHPCNGQEAVDTGFKSYYVVWKRKSDRRKTILGFCLNRTMQYGNNFIGVPSPMMYSSLNRTMQYGNPSSSSSPFTIALSLNRTMQYGNNKQQWKTKKEYGV